MKRIPMTARFSLWLHCLAQLHRSFRFESPEHGVAAGCFDCDRVFWREEGNA